MFEDSAITSVAHVIQLSVAPVFLLTGIGSMLSVMTTRFARIIDRSRVLEVMTPSETHTREQIENELRSLARRGVCINRSITLCTITALLISLVIAILFMGAFVAFDTSIPVAFLFITAMLCLITALIYFLKEIMHATSSVRIGRH